MSRVELIGADRLATEVEAAIDALIAGAPGALNTLKELADAINDDASFAAAVVTALAGKQPLDPDLTAIAALDSATPGVIASDGSGWFRKAFSGLKTSLGLVKGDVGLGNVDNTSDLAKPVSDATASAIEAEATLRTAADLLLIPLTQKGANDGVATLGPDGKVPSDQIPPLAIGDTFNVDSEAAMLALDAQRGDVAIRTDLDPDGMFILTADDPTILANWQQITSPGAVLSVNGYAGAVVLVKGDIGLGNVDNTSDVNKPISDATAAALDGKQPLDADLTAIAGLGPANDDVIQRKAGVWTNRTPAQVKADLNLAKGDVALGNVDNTSDANKPISDATAAALAAKQAADADLTTIAGLDSSTAGVMATDGGGWFRKTWAAVRAAITVLHSELPDLAANQHPPSVPAIHDITAHSGSQRHDWYDEGVLAAQQAISNLKGSLAQVVENLITGRNDLEIRSYERIAFYRNAITANMPVTAALHPGTAQANPYVATRPGSIVGVTITTQTDVTQGTITVEVYKNGVATGLIATVAAATVAVDGHYSGKGVQLVGADTFVADDDITLGVSSDNILPAGSANCALALEVALD